MTITVDTIVGPMTFPSPGQDLSDGTAERAWIGLLENEAALIFGPKDGQLRRPFKTQRDRAVCEGVCEVLASCLSYTNGMTAYYWRDKAEEVVRDCSGNLRVN